MPVRERAKSVWVWRLLSVVIVLCVAAYIGVSQYRIHFMAARALPPYDIPPMLVDDTLRVAIIGDSWAEYHTTLNCDSLFSVYGQRLFHRPVQCRSRGKGGSKSKEIYHFMFQSMTVEHANEPDRCTQPLLERHPCYCVIFAGINDVVHKRDADYYAGNMKLIIRLLLHQRIRPVVMEIPTLDFLEVIARKGFWTRVAYGLAACLPGASGQDAVSHRAALERMLNETHLCDSVLYIKAAQWNPDGLDDQRQIHTDDRLHLTLEGYHILDSCLVSEIVRDYQRVGRQR